MSACEKPRGSAASRKRRGADTQRLVAEAWRGDGWPFAEPVGAGAPGRDITGTPGIALEVKARRGFSPQEWLRQAARNAKPGEVPAVVLRPDGFGPATVDDWAVIVPHSVFRDLLRAAGYGEPREEA
jgi:hypothetical protein